MFLHEIMKGADPSHLAFTGEVDVTYGALEDAIHRYRNAITHWASAKASASASTPRTAQNSSTPSWPS